VWYLTYDWRFRVISPYTFGHIDIPGHGENGLGILDGYPCKNRVPSLDLKNEAFSKTRMIISN